MAIPKVIHYCWLSNEPYPELITKCMNSWHEILSDYEFKLWNLDNFDVNMCDYTRQAYEMKKYAFVSDYIRLYALYHEGGIYLDTDIEVVKKLDGLLKQKAFTGFQNHYSLAAWIFGSEKGNPLFGEFLEYYKDRSFVLKNGKMDLTPNPVPITEICKKYGLNLNNKLQILPDITIYPEEYFCPYDHISNKLFLTDNSYTIHYFNNAWFTDEQKLREKKRREIQIKYGKLGGYFFQAIHLLRYEGLKALIVEIKRFLRL